MKDIETLVREWLTVNFPDIADDWDNEDKVIDLVRRIKAVLKGAGI